jgi:hypothetical protein
MKKPCIICDLDGTLCQMSDRTIYDSDKAINDKPIRAVVDILNRYKDMDIIIVTAREIKDENVTQKWLKDNNIHYTKVIFKNSSMDKSYTDDVFKKDCYEKYIHDRYDVLFVLEDRTPCVNMWRYIGLTCLQVNDNL